jgi:hypothetical protein
MADKWADLAHNCIPRYKRTYDPMYEKQWTAGPDLQDKKLVKSWKERNLLGNHFKQVTGDLSTRRSSL